MPHNVIFLDGPIGVGKTSLGRAAALHLGADFIDGDDHSAKGPWLRSILHTSRSIAAACLHSTVPCVIVAYPLRCTDWRFYSATFARAGIACHCIGLIATPAQIARRARHLSADEISRSTQMIAQGYGQRAFAALTLRTDAAGVEETTRWLCDAARHLGSKVKTC